MADFNLKGLKEHALFLGRKIDKLAETVRSSIRDQKIDVSMSDQKIQVDLGNAFEQFNNAIETLRSSINAFSGQKIVIPEIDVSPIVESLAKLESIGDKVDPETHKLLEEVIKSINSIKTPEVNFGEVVKELKNVGKKIDKIPMPQISNKDVVMAITGLGKKIDKIPKVKFPEVMKLDHMQVSRMAGGGAAVSTKTYDIPKGYEQLTITGTAGGFASVPAKADKCLVVVSTADIRWRDDGTNPTSTVGVFWPRRNHFELNSRSSMNAFRAIRTSSTSATLDISYYERV